MQCNTSCGPNIARTSSPSGSPASRTGVLGLPRKGVLQGGHLTSGSSASLLSSSDGEAGAGAGAAARLLSPEDDDDSESSLGDDDDVSAFSVSVSSGTRWDIGWVRRTEEGGKHLYITSEPWMPKSAQKPSEAGKPAGVLILLSVLMLARMIAGVL